MRWVGLTASIFAMFLVAPVGFAQEAPGSLAETEEAASEDAAEPVLTNQFPLPQDESLRRARRADRSEERLGIGSPSLRLFSQIELGMLVTSNADQAPGGDGADFGVSVAPELRLQSNWSRHELRLRANGQGAYFASSKELDIDTLGVSGTFRLDIRRSTQLEFDAAYAATPASVISQKLDQEFSSGVRLTHDFGAIETNARVGVVLSKPDEGDSFIEPSISLRATLNTHSGLRPFAETTYAPRIISGGADSQGASFAAGFAFEREPFLTGELAAVYTFRKGEDLEQAVGARGSVTWTPTDFTAITFASDVEIEDEDRTLWSANTSVNHQLTDEIELFAGLSGTIEDIEDRPDQISVESNAGLAWSFNENLAWALRYENLFVLSGEETSEHRAIASIILRR